MNMLPPTHRQATMIWLAATGLAIAVLVGLIGALFWALGHLLHILAPVLWPLAVAAILAYLLDPIVDFLERKGMPRLRAIVAVFVLALGFLCLLLASVVPRLVDETRQLAERVPAYVETVRTRAENFINHPPALLRRFLQKDHAAAAEPAVGTTNAVTVATNAVAGTNAPAPAVAPDLNNEQLQSATTWLANALPTAGRWLFGQVTKVASWFGIIAALALIPVYTFYFLLEREGIARNWTTYLPLRNSRLKEELIFVLSAINGYLIAFFRGQVLVAICNAILYAIGFSLIRLPYAIVLGASGVILTMVPFVGAAIICITAVVIAVVTFGDWLHPLLAVAVFSVAQTLEGLFISPRIMGDRVGLHPVMIIIAVMAGTELLGGLLGGILAIPLMAALRVILLRYVWQLPEEPQKAASEGDITK